jgi:hypothetical protein
LPLPRFCFRTEEGAIISILAGEGNIQKGDRRDHFKFSQDDETYRGDTRCYNPYSDDPEYDLRDKMLTRFGL